MSILSKDNMGAPSFVEFTKQASFFLKEKIKSARLALTDVTAAELLTEEATSGNPWAPDTRTLATISRAAFELDDFFRIVEILHKRFSRFEKKNWRVSYNSLLVLERLLTHGPESVAGEFQNDKDVIIEMENFQYIDEKGFNWGLAVRKKSERILKLLEKETFLKEERDRARKLTRGIKGFGSLCHRSSSSQGILQESSRGALARSNSQFIDQDSNENQMLFSSDKNLIKKEEQLKKSHEDDASEFGKKNKLLNSLDSFNGVQILNKIEIGRKENMAPKMEELHRWNCTAEANPLLDGKSDEMRIIEEDHSFSDIEDQTTASLITRDGILQGC